MRRLLLLVVAATLVAGAWIVLGTDEGSVGPDGIGGRAPEDEAGPAPTLAGRGVPREASDVAWKAGDAFLEGLVVDAALQAVAGVLVEAQPQWRLGEPPPRPRHARELTPHVPPSADPLRARSDAHGAFRIEGLAPGWRYRVTARPEPPRAGTTAFAEVGDDDIVLQVESGTALRVRVVDGRGRGVEASVTARPAETRYGRRPRGTWEQPWTATGPDGRLTLAAVPAGMLELGVRTEPERVRLGIHVRAPTSEEILLRVEEPDGGRVVGLVRDQAGALLEGARIAIRTNGREGTASVSTLATTTSDAAGRYAFDALPPGTIESIRGVATGCVPDEPAYGRGYAVLPGATATVPVTLIREIVVRGRIRTPEGRPVPGVTFRASITHALYRVQAQATSRADGTYELRGLGPGPLQVKLLSAGYVLAGVTDTPMDPTRTTWVLPEGGEVAERDLVVHEGCVIRGRVVDQNGQTVAGARVEILMMGTGEHPVSGWSREARSGADGRFRVAGLGAVPDFGLRAFHADALSPRAFTSADPEDEIVLTLRRGAVIEGHVLDAAGRPAAGVQVKRGDSQGRRTSVVSGSDGSFRFAPLPPDTYYLGVRDPHVPFAGPWAEVRLDWGETESDVILRLAEPSAVTGTVVDAADRPVPGAVVLLTAADQNARSSGWARTDGDGRFEVGPLAPIPHRVSIDAVWMESHVEGGANDVLLVHARAPLRSIAGEIRGPDGEPVGHAAVRIEMGPEGKRGERSVYVSATGGLFAWTGRTEADAVNLRIQGALEPGGRRLPVAPLVRREVPLDGEPVMIDLPPSRVVRGRVVDEDGRAVPGAWLRITPSVGPLVAQAFRVPVQADGTFSITGLPEGGFTVGLDLPPSAWAQQAPVPVGAGEEELILRADRGVPVGGRVVLPDGRPVRRALVYVGYPVAAGGSADWALTGETDGTGHFLLRAAKRVPQVWVRINLLQASQEARTHAPPLDRLVRVPAEDLLFELSPAVSVEGEVVDEHGEPVTQFSILLEPAGPPGAGPAQFVDREDGSNRFSVDGLARGTYRLRVLQPYRRDLIEVVAPAKDVRVVVPVR